MVVVQQIDGKNCVLYGRIHTVLVVFIMKWVIVKNKWKILFSAFTSQLHFTKTIFHIVSNMSGTNSNNNKPTYASGLFRLRRPSKQAEKPTPASTTQVPLTTASSSYEADFPSLEEASSSPSISVYFLLNVFAKLLLQWIF